MDFSSRSRNFRIKVGEPALHNVLLFNFFLPCDTSLMISSSYKIKMQYLSKQILIMKLVFRKKFNIEQGEKCESLQFRRLYFPIIQKGSKDLSVLKLTFFLLSDQFNTAFSYKFECLSDCYFHKNFTVSIS